MRYFWVVLVIAMGVLSVEADQIVLSNGDRLNGKVVSLDSKVCVFQSPALGELKVGMDQITAITTEEAQPVLLENDLQPRQAVIVSEGESLYVQDASERYATELNQIIALGDGAVQKALEDPDKFHFSGSVEVGVNGRSGNTKRTQGLGRIDAQWKNPVWTISSFAYANYAQQADSNNEMRRTENELAGGVEADRYVSDFLSVFASSTFENDEFEDLRLRNISLAGVKLHWLRGEPIAYYNALGLGNQYENYYDGRKDNAFIGSVESNLKWKINSRLDFIQRTIWYPELEDMAAYRIVAETGMKVYLNTKNNFFLKAGLKHEYNSQPNNSEIKKLDTYYFSQLGYQF